MYEIFSQIFGKFIAFPVLAVGLSAIGAWIKRGVRLKQLIFWWWYVPLFAIGALTYFACWKFEKNARDWSDLKVTLDVSKGVHGTDVLSVRYQNQSSMPMQILGTSYAINGSDAFAKNNRPISIASKTERSIEMGEVNDPSIQYLALVNINFRFADGYLSDDPPRVIQCRFSLSPSGSSVKSLTPEDCGETGAEGGDRASAALEKALSLPSARFSLDLTENGVFGSSFKAGKSPGWTFTYLPDEKVAYLVRGRPGSQIGVVANVGEVPSKRHRFEGNWVDRDRIVSLTIDGVPKGYNIPEKVWDEYSGE